MSTFSPFVAALHVFIGGGFGAVLRWQLGRAMTGWLGARSFLNLHGNLLEQVPPPVVWTEMKKLKTLYIGGNCLPLPDHVNILTAPQAF